jgi:(p)ppGpp synthase/HD superfamily hydrolase
MKRVEELAQENSKPIWEHFTATKPAKTRISRKRLARKHIKKTRTSDNPLTNVFIRMQKKRSSSRVTKATTRRYKKTDLISQIYTKLGKMRSTSKDPAPHEVGEQIIEDRLGDVPM